MSKENNILIAEFMGIDYDINVINSMKELEDSGHRNPMYIAYNYSFYHNSWDWLMPVVDKIENLHEANNVLIGRNITYIQIHNEVTNEQETFKGAFTSKLESVYNAVIEFIKWYNKNIKT